MTTRTKLVCKAFLVPLMTIIAGLGCATGTDPQSDEEFIVQVDSVIVPSPVGSDEPLKLKFYGFLGTNLCPSFERFESARSLSRVDVTVIGVRKRGQLACATAISRLRGQEFNVQPPFQDRLTIVVHQADGSQLVYVVAVPGP